MKTTRDELSPSSGKDSNEQKPPPKKRLKVATGPRVECIYCIYSTSMIQIKLATNQVILETASRIDNVISEFIKYTQILADHSKKNKARQNTVIHKLKGPILPMLNIASKTIKDIINICTLWRDGRLTHS